jgi:hypothetical protein
MRCIISLYKAFKLITGLHAYDRKSFAVARLVNSE